MPVGEWHGYSRSVHCHSRALPALGWWRAPRVNVPQATGMVVTYPRQSETRGAVATARLRRLVLMIAIAALVLVLIAAPSQAARLPAHAPASLPAAPPGQADS